MEKLGEIFEKKRCLLLKFLVKYYCHINCRRCVLYKNTSEAQFYILRTFLTILHFEGFFFFFFGDISYKQNFYGAWVKTSNYISKTIFYGISVLPKYVMLFALNLIELNKLHE